MKISNIILYAACAGLFAQACKPKLAEDKDLPSPSTAVIAASNYLPTDDPDYANAYIFKDATPGGFISSWDFGGIKKSQKPSDSVFFAYKGTYKIKLVSASKGGSSEIVQEIVVPTTSIYAANFSITPMDDYHFIVEVITPNVTKSQFKYANGDTSSALKDTVYFPWIGSYDIALTATVNKGGSNVSSTFVQKVEVKTEDPNNPDATDPVFVLLTGGPQAANGKTWILQNFNGVGPLDSKVYNGTRELGWFKNNDGIPGESWQSGMASNEFTFNIRQYQFIPKSTKATIHFDAANHLFGKNQAQYADIALDDPKLAQAPFILRSNPKLPTPVKYSLTFTNGSYFGYHENRYYYEIVTIKEDTLYIRQPYSDNVMDNPADDSGGRYFTYVKKK